MSVNHEVKGALAKLLATENLVIEHKKVSTACFDVLNRVLTLPIWDRASSVVYDLLVGHEVGHALYTPTEDWSKTHCVPKDFVNVVEDARVEKLMKRRYPGLAKSFYNGYKELNEDDFFGISGTDMGRVSLIDRINLHFKIGAHAFVPFSTEEQIFVDMTANAETFDEVLEVCQRILEYVKNKKQEEQPTVEQTASANFGEGGEQLQKEESDDMSDDSSEESMNEDNQSGEEEGNNNPSQTYNDPVDETVSETQRTFNEEAEKLTNKSRFEDPIYVEIPKVNLETIVFKNKDVREYLTKSFWGIGKDKERHYGNIYAEADKEFNNYKKESQKEVNYLVKEFEMKKCADSYQRLSLSKSGVLDTSKLHTYKYSEDLFKKISVIPDGKNHGLIFILDWSGSMGNYLLDTVKQLFNLLWFCKKAQIPFEVYGFTQEWNPRYLGDDKSPYTYDLPDHYSKHHGTISVCKYFHLLNFFSSQANNKDFQTDCINLWRLAYKIMNAYTAQYQIPYGFDLSSTPLNESIITLHQLIPEFKTKYKVQKTNVVLLTDGEANNIQYDVNLSKKYPDGPDRLGCHILHNQVLRDRKLGRIYRAFSHEMPDWVTTILLENLKDNFPEINLIGFRILNGTAASALVRESQCVNRYNYANDPKAVKKVENLMTTWKKEKAVELNEGVGYQALYAISSNNLSVNTSFDVSDNASTKEIGKAFRGMLKKKTVNKKILSSFSSLIS